MNEALKNQLLEVIERAKCQPTKDDVIAVLEGLTHDLLRLPTNG